MQAAWATRSCPVLSMPFALKEQKERSEVSETAFMRNAHSLPSARRLASAAVHRCLLTPVACTQAAVPSNLFIVHLLVVVCEVGDVLKAGTKAHPPVRRNLCNGEPHATKNILAKQGSVQTDCPDCQQTAPAMAASQIKSETNNVL